MFGDVKGESEGTGSSVSTDCLKAKHFKDIIESKYLLWEKYEETIDHLTSRCFIVEKDNVIRSDEAYTNLHYSVGKNLGVETRELIHICTQLCLYNGIKGYEERF
jgi:tRNA G10  N-methylase Trm11